MSDKHDIRTTTFRAEAELLRTARYLLDREDKSVAQFLVEALEQYVAEHADQLPQSRRTSARTPVGARD